jgi:hypothetical protein
MNFIIVERLGGHSYQITLTKGLWVFAATAIPLTLFTIGLWYVWDRRKCKESVVGLGVS